MSNDDKLLELVVAHEKDITELQQVSDLVLLHDAEMAKLKAALPEIKEEMGRKLAEQASALVSEYSERISATLITKQAEYSKDTEEIIRRELRRRALKIVSDLSDEAHQKLEAAQKEVIEELRPEVFKLATASAAQVSREYAEKTPNIPELIKKEFATLATIGEQMISIARGNWNADVNYKKGDIIYFKGSSYLVLKTTRKGDFPQANNQNSKDATYQILAAAGAPGPAGSGSGDGLPSQTGNAGKYLTTNGTTASWAAVAGSGTVTSVSSANANIGVSNPTIAPVLTLAAALAGVNSITSATGQTLTLATLDGNKDINLTPHGTGKVAIGGTGPLQRLHIKTNSTLPGLVAGNMAHDYYGLVVESEDAVLGLASRNEGGHGSTIDLMEVNSGVLADKWTIGRNSSGASESSALTFFYGTDPDYALNTEKMSLTTAGALRLPAVGQTLSIGTTATNGTLTLYGSGTQTILNGTSDGADAHRISIGGGGANSVTRGAYLNLMGNEYSGQEGDLALLAGDSTQGRIRFFTGNAVERGSVSKTGDLTWLNTTEATTGAAGSITTAGGIYSAKKIITATDVVAGGTIAAGTGPTTLTDSAGKILSAALNTVAVAQGGTGLTTGTSGGVLYYSASGTLASSAALAANALVIGGGAGVAPSTITTGTSVLTALAVNVGTDGAFVVKGGALGTPSSGTLTNCTGMPKADVMEAPLFAADAGSTDDYAATLSPAISGYVTGCHYRFKANTANTGAATINFNSLGAKTIKKAAGGITTDLADNDIRAGQWVDLVYDGTNMQMQSTLGNAAGGSTPTYLREFVSNGAVSLAASTTYYVGWNPASANNTTNTRWNIAIPAGQTVTGYFVAFAYNCAGGDSGHSITVDLYKNGTTSLGSSTTIVSNALASQKVTVTGMSASLTTSDTLHLVFTCPSGMTSATTVGFHWGYFYQ